MKKFFIGAALLSISTLAAANGPQVPNSQMAPKMEATKTASPFVESLKNRKELSIFLKAYQASGADAALVKGENYTFFIPTDEAFQKLPPNVLEDLMKPENRDKLKAIVLMHIISKKMAAKELRSGAIKNLQGKNLDFFIRGSAITVDGANLIQMDQAIPGGTFHEIDMVILPDTETEKKPLQEKAVTPVTNPGMSGR